MSESLEQNSPRVVLFVGLSGLAALFARDLDLAPSSEDEDPVEHANRLIAGIMPGAEAAAAALEDIGLIKAGLEAHGFAVVDATSAPEKMAEVLSALRARDGELQSAQAELASIKRQLSAQKGQVTKARNEAARTSDANARKLPEDPPVIAREDRQAIIDLVAASDRAEIVAFEDDAEIVQIKPLDLKGQIAASLSEGGEGVTLSRYEKWLVLGPTETTVSITSWGLYVDGELVAWRERPNGKLTLGSGTQFDLTPDVIF